MLVVLSMCIAFFIKGDVASWRTLELSYTPRFLPPQFTIFPHPSSSPTSSSRILLSRTVSAFPSHILHTPRPSRISSKSSVLTSHFSSLHSHDTTMSSCSFPSITHTSHLSICPFLITLPCPSPQFHLLPLLSSTWSAT